MFRELQAESGVTISQFALVFPLFMLFIVVLIDFGRFSSYRAVLQEGAHRAIERSTTVPNLDIDPRGRQASDVEYLRLKLAREKAERAGLNFIDGVGVVETKADADLVGNNGPQLLDIVYTETRLAGTLEQTTGKMAVLMPGECAFIPKMNHTECNRETLGTTPSDPAPVEVPARLLDRHPVKVVAFATFDSFTPLLFSRPFKVVQFAYRQPIPQGPFPAFEDPGLQGAVGSPPSPDDNEPLGAVELPDEPVPPCVPDWGRCLTESAGTSNPVRKSVIPAHWLPAEPDGSCRCEPASERP